jgi:hypothetical protein
MHEIERQLEHIKRASLEVLFIEFPNRETTLKTRKVLLEIIQTAIDKVLTNTVTSNGSTMTKYVLEELLALKKTVINLS